MTAKQQLLRIAESLDRVPRVDESGERTTDADSPEGTVQVRLSATVARQLADEIRDIAGRILLVLEPTDTVGRDLQLS